MAKPLLVAAAAVLMAAATYTPATRTHPSHGGGGWCYPRLFAFGDSLIDTGNFIHYSTAPGPVARSPYGETFFHRPGHRPMVRRPPNRRLRRAEEDHGELAVPGRRDRRQ